MLALSIRQPWASLIMRAGKDVENRNWHTKYRGRILVHAAKGCTRDEYAGAIEFAESIIKKHIPTTINDIPRGGFIGTVEIVDCVTASSSPWFVGEYGFLLRDPVRLKRLVPYKGRLGFFEVPDTLLAEALP